MLCQNHDRTCAYRCNIHMPQRMCGPGELTSTDLSSNPNSIEMTREAQETNKPKIRESCAKLSELKIGMTVSEALLLCERKPLRITEAIIRGGKKEINWAYWGSYLHFVDGKLTSVQDLQ